MFVKDKQKKTTLFRTAHLKEGVVGSGTTEVATTTHMISCRSRRSHFLSSVSDVGQR